MYSHHIQNLIGPVQIKLKTEENNTATFEVSPLPSCFGYTLGNSLRRCLISSISGSAIVGVKINGMDHEFTSMDGLRESGLELILNLRKVVISSNLDSFVMELSSSTKGPIKAGDFKVPSGVEIVNKDLVIANITNDKFKLEISAFVEKGVGFKTAQENNRRDEFGYISIDSLFSPIKEVNMTVTNTRVGEFTDLDSLLIKIETNGSIKPEDALKIASNMLRYYFGLFDESSVPYIDNEVKEIVKANESNNIIQTEEYTPIEAIPISSRTANSLINGGIFSVEQLCKCSKKDLIELKGFGKKGLEEVASALLIRGLKLIDDK